LVLLEVEEKGPYVPSLNLFIGFILRALSLSLSLCGHKDPAELRFLNLRPPMASWVFSECGLKPRIYPRELRDGLASNTTFPSKRRPPPICKSHCVGSSLRLSSGLRGNSWWALNVSAPLRVPSVGEEDEKGKRVSGVEDDGEFDPSSPPPFRLADIRAAIPKYCWVKDPWRSMSYVVRDVVVVFGLAAVAAYFNNWIVWPLYWIAQGTMFWALFVLGHDW